MIDFRIPVCARTNAQGQAICYNDPMAKLTEAIKSQIKASGRTQYRIAKDTGITQGHLSRLTRGQSGLSIEHAETLADYLGLEIILRPKSRTRKAAK